MPLRIDPKKQRAWLRRVRELTIETPPPPIAPPATAPDMKARRVQTGLGALVTRGWAVSYDALLRIKLTRGPMDTGYCVTEREACDRARELEKASKE